MRCLLVALFATAALAQEPAAVPIGSEVKASFVDLRWQVRQLPELGSTHATIVYFATIECPLVQRYLPRLGTIAAEYAPRGVVTLVANVGAGDPFVDAVGDVLEKAPKAEFAKDTELALAKACGVDRTAAVVVLDRERRIVYRGRIDDQHGYSASRAKASRDDLRLALDDVLAQQPVRVPETAISGCKITPPVAPAPSSPPTFAKDIVPVLQQHCVACHRPGGEAPFPLVTLADTQKHAAMIAEVVEQGRMPPWYGSATHDRFVNHRGLSAAERATVLAWVTAGSPAGDGAAEAKLPAVDADGWRIGKPDKILELKAPVRLPAEGPIPYRYFVLPFHFAEDTWVEAIEIRPENERALHHCNLARVKFGEKFSQEGFITGYVPGGDPLAMDPGIAVRIPAGSALALQAHYVPTGQPEVDRIRVGLRFPRQKVDKEMQVAIAADFRFAIPPGARAHPVRASRTLRDDAIGIGMFVHMHLRGRDMTATAELPDGSVQTLLVVPNYNFDWQQSYRWARGAKTFPKGTKIKALAHFDNSAWNPFNPDPTQTVKFGLETEEEMMYLFTFWYAANEQLGVSVDPKNGHVL